LQSRTGGTTIATLRKQFLEQLPVPVPPLAVQHRVAADVREHGVDAFTQLTLMLTRDESDPLARWIDRSMRHLAESPHDSGADPSLVVRLRVFGSEFDAVRQWAVPDDDPPPLMAWALNLVNVANLFDGSEDIPPGPILLSLLQQGMADLRQAESRIESHSPLEGRARDLTKKCVVRLRQTLDHMLETHTVAIAQEKDALTAGETQEMAFLAWNDGPLPLRNFTIHSHDWGFRSEPILLNNGEKRTIRVEVKAPAKVGPCSLKFEWSAKALDGQTVGAEQDFPLRIESRSRSESPVDLGHSPYFISQPVGPDRNDVFFGREELLARISSQVQSGNTVLLEGNRRAGKSSILKHLEGRDRIPGWLAIYSSFQGAAGNNEVAGMRSDAVWRTLAQSIATGLLGLGVDVPLPDGSVLKAGASVGVARACRTGISQDAPWEDFQDYLGSVLRLLDGLDLGLVLMIDEFDKLQEGIDNGVTSPQIPENIRFLIQTQPRFVAIMTGSRRMQRLRNEYWSALYGLGNRAGVTALDESAARQLVTEPVKGRLNYSAKALDRVVALTARQPFLIQYLCNRIFEIASHHKQSSISADLVDEAARAFVEDNEHFASLWGYAETDRRRYLIALCHREGRGPDPLTFGVIQEHLAGEGIEVSDTDLDEDLKFLQELELIDYLGAESGGRYALTIPLMGRWLDSQQDYNALLAKARAEQEKQL